MPVIKDNLYLEQLVNIDGKKWRDIHEEGINLRDLPPNVLQQITYGTNKDNVQTQGMISRVMRDDQKETHYSFIDQEIMKILQAHQNIEDRADHIAILAIDNIVTKFE